MCGRFTNMLSWSEYVALLRIHDDAERGRNTQARYNIAPTQQVLFAHQDQGGQRVVSEGRWWLVPHWAKEIPKVPLFNARIETVAETPAYRDAFKSRRCLIPADGYYEWTVGEDKKKDPHFIHLLGIRPFAFAGLWAHNSQLGITSCTIITAPTVPAIAALHDRMPVILDPAAYDEWLEPTTPVPDALKLLDRNLDDELISFRVDRQVNTFKFDGPDAIRPIDA